MKKVGRATGTAISGLMIFVGGAAMAPPAQAEFVVNIVQDGGNVVATGSGSLDLAALSFDGASLANPGVLGQDTFVNVGPVASNAEEYYGSISGPFTFGPGNVFIIASSGTGDFAGTCRDCDMITVPEGYISGNSLSDSATWDDTTLAGLGLISGTYTWT